MNGNTANLGPLTPYHPPPLGALRNYAVNREGQNEVVWQPIYHYQDYAAAGTTQLTFFQDTVGTAGTTLADTNIRQAGTLPAPQEFLLTGIQVMFLAQNAISSADAAVGTTQDNWVDTFDVMFGDGWLELFIGSKPYLQDGPLAKFTQQFRLGGIANIARGTGGAGADTVNFVDYAVHSGRYYSITPVKLPTTQNFAVTINFPTVITVVTQARIGVILDGFLYRLSQ